MKKINNKFKIGDLVVFKTHPLLNDFRIKGDSNYVPPILLVQEVFIENNKKIIFDEETGKQIAEKIKYHCIHFDDNKSQFIESILYENMLEHFKMLKIERIDSDGNIKENTVTIVEEIESYKTVKYEYGKVVRFKTKKIEIYKKRSSKKIPADKKGEIIKDKIKQIIQYVVNYTTPDFVICGLKQNEVVDLFYPNGNPKRIVSRTLFKVKWFNPIGQKYSEQYLPQEFFTDEMKFD